MSPGLHPVASLAYRVFAGNAWYQAQTLLQDQKLVRLSLKGHYMKVAPRATFFAQLYGAIVGSGINYATLVWVINTKRPYLDGTAQDPLNQWTGQTAKSYSNQAIIYGLIGPARLFQSARYTPLLWGFLLGAIAPIIIWLLNRRFPKAGFLFWNTTIFFDSMGNWQGYITAGNISSFIGGFVCMFYFFRYKHNVWKEYNYLIGAALDTGTNLAIMVIFIAFSGIATVSAPTWWGNDPNSVGLYQTIIIIG
ncbi:OPT oligopeptide transporter protein-domain-containing protein [Endogone sp. FLAS-F59071]|nr:OPT oligopeptide transporter protein-domain-containing protein [Endogone sp. FLAS-F59071]|eukprot:RUS13877.1 OPT oligopeptide transporter protein-domain-containing protein [Endogone sp. FLAS-F59071]